MTHELTQLTEALADRYRVSREAGRGGMATVYLAEDLKHGRNVAIKVLNPELAAALGPDRFLREIEISARLDHPHILPLYDSGDADGFLFYVMPFVEGESLRDRIAREHQLPLDDALQIAREVADALSYAHSHDVVHRDIKPENILLAGGHARVADFGIARAISEAGGERLTQTGLAVGTPVYMSPEQAAGSQEVDGRADLYSLGCVLFEMLAGQAPFTGSPESIVRQHLTVDPPNITSLRPAIPAEVAAAVMRSLSKTPADRFSPAAQFAEALRPATTSTPAAPAAPTSVHVSPAAAAGIFCGAGVVVLGLVYVLVQQIGLPSWVFGVAIALLVIGLPMVVATAVAEGRGKTSALLNWRRTLWGGGTAFAGLALVTVGFMTMRSLGIGPAATLISSGAMDARERLILADFEARGGDPTHAATATELMRISLAQSTAISLMDPLQLNRTLELMRRDPSDGISDELALAAAKREGFKGIVTGDVGAVGSALTLSARLVSTDGDVLLALTERASSPEEIIDAVDRLSTAMREQFGESLRNIRRGEPLERVTTGSMRAMRIFTQGLTAWNQGDQARAMQLLEEAIGEDSMFAMAYRKLAIILSNENEQRARAVEMATKAYDYRNRLTERERYLVTAAYHSVVTGNRDLQIRAYRNVLDQYPDDTYALNNLGVIYGALRDFERSAELYGQALQVDPTTRLYYSNLSTTLGRRKMWDTAAFISDLFAERFPENPEVKLSGVLLAALRQDYDSAEILVEGLLADQRGTVFWEAIAYEWWGHLDALQGRLGDADRRWQRAFDLTTDRGVGGAYLDRVARRATVERLLLDDPERGLSLLRKAEARYPLQELVPLDRPYPQLAFAYATVGATDRATTLLEEYDATREADHSIDAERWAHGARGVVALIEDRIDDAITSLRAFDDGNGCATCAYPWLARAYDRTGQEDSVLALYERFTDLPSYDLWYDGGHIGPAYNRLGEIYEARGDKQRAIDNYTTVVDLWTRADSAFQPWVENARRAIERLTAEPREIRR